MPQAAAQIRLLESMFQKRDECTIASSHKEASIIVKRISTCNEYFKNGDIICPYMDLDRYIDIDSNDDEVNQLEEDYEKMIKRSLLLAIQLAYYDYRDKNNIKSIQDYDNDPRDFFDKIIVGKRETRVYDEKRKKISIHAINPYFKTDYVKFGLFLRSINFDAMKVNSNCIKKHKLRAMKPGDMIPIDLGVYKSREQLMNCFGCVKDNSMKPITWAQNEYFDSSLVPLIQCPHPNAFLLNIEIDKPIIEKTTNKTSNYSLDDARKLLFMLNEQRYKYNDWYKTGLMMHNSFEGSEDALELWCEWSSKAPIELQGDGLDECLKKWNSFDSSCDNPLTIGTLHMWAKEDNFDAYKQIFLQESSTNLEFIAESDDESIATSVSVTSSKKALIPSVANVGFVQDEATYYVGSYKEMKKKFELRNFKVNNPIAYVELRNQEIMIRSTTSKRYEAVWYDKPVYNKDGEIASYTKEKFCKAWGDDPQKRTYHNMDFIPPPLVCSEETFNIWRGFDVELYKCDDVADQVNDIIEFIKSVVCASDETSYNYIIKWIANLFQTPGSRTKTSIVIIGKQGDGKSYFTELLTAMIGDAMSYTTGNAAEYFERFDGGARLHKILNVFNEINFEVMGKQADYLKGLITDAKIRHETKGVDPIEVQNHARFIFTSNSAAPIKIEQTDRRFVVLRTSSSRNNDYEYWSKMQSYKSNKAVLRGLYEYLMNVDIPKKYDWKEERPITEDYKEIAGRSIDTIFMFLTYIVYTQRLETETYTTSKLCEKYNSFLTRFHFNKTVSPVMFGRTLNGLIRDFKEVGISNTPPQDGYIKKQITKTKLIEILTDRGLLCREFDGVQEE